MIVVFGHLAKTRRPMASAARPDKRSREPRCLLLTPLLARILRLLLLALMWNVALAQWTTQLRSTCSADSASALCCTSRCDDNPRSRAKLAGVVSAFRESEALAAERGFNLTAAVERYRTDVIVRSELAAGAARNMCDALVLEFQASIDAAASGSLAAADRLSANVSDALRRATDERAALGRRMDSADDRLRTHDANLSLIERSLNETRWELNATSGGVFANERQRVADMNVMRLSTLSNFALIEDRLDSTQTQLNESVAHLSLRHDSLNDSLTALGAAFRHDIEMASITAESQLLVAKGEILSNMSSLENSITSKLQLTNKRVNTSSGLIDKLFAFSGHQGSAISHLNQTLQRSEATLRIELSALDVQLNLTRSKTERNFSSLADALASSVNLSNVKFNTCVSQVLELFTIADQQKSAVRHLNRTQQESDVSCAQRAWALSAELNKTKSDLERLSDRHERLKVDHDRLVNDARTMSAQLRACPSGWRRNGDSCFFLVTGWNATWSDARARCNALAADFVTVYNQTVNNFLNEYMIANGINVAWLGATDVASEGAWRWVTGEIFRRGNQQISYANFAAGEPNNNYFSGRSTENCLVMNRLGTWNDVPCALTLAFFCQTHRP